MCVCVCVCVCTHEPQISPPNDHVSLENLLLKNRFRVRLQISIETIRVGDQTAMKKLHKVPLPHFLYCSRA